MKCTTDWEKMYKLCLEESHSIEKELAALKASLPKIKADAVRDLLNTGYTCESPNGDDAWAGSAIEEFAKKLEAGK